MARKINKKGSIQDILFVGMVLLVFGLVVLFGFRFMSAIDDQLQSKSSDIVTAEAKTASTTLTNHYTGIIDNSFLFLTLGLGIMVLIFAAMVRIHPIFIPVFFVGLIFIIFLSGLFSNIYQEAATTSELTGYASQLTFTTTILTWLPLIIGVFGILLMVVQYKIWQQEQ